MPSRVERKLMKHGTSGVVAIPMSYRKYHDLNPGDEVVVLWDDLLLILPKKDERLMENKMDLIDKLLRGLTFCVGSRRGRG